MNHELFLCINDFGDFIENHEDVDRNARRNFSVVALIFYTALCFLLIFFISANRLSISTFNESRT